MNLIDNPDLLALATAFVNQGNTTSVCVVDSIKDHGSTLEINYSWAKGSNDWWVTPLELMAWGWNNPKV